MKQLFIIFCFMLGGCSESEIEVATVKQKLNRVVIVTSDVQNERPDLFIPRPRSKPRINWSKLDNLNKPIQYASILGNENYQNRVPTGDPIYQSDSVTDLLTDIQVLNRYDAQQIVCLALNIYHEARGSTKEDQIATALVVLNRVRHSSFPNTICEVIWQYYKTRNGKQIAQFSWTRDNVSDIPKNRTAWKLAQKLAFIVYFEDVPDITNGRLNYFAHKVVNPSWARGVKNKIIIGSHTYLTAKEHLYIGKR